MTLVDTHCHLHFDAFDADREAVIDRAREAGVRYLVNVGTDPVTNEAAHRLTSGREGMWHTAGLHPHHSHEVSDAEIERVADFIVRTRPVAIGEIGLDYFKSEAKPERQKKVFARLLNLALEHDLPVIVHSREAFGDTLDLIRSEGRGRLRGVMHCFSYDVASLKKLLDAGFLASFTCNVTYKSAASLLEAACAAPADRIMLETDSPYLSPQAHRGKRNEPAHLSVLAAFLAEKRSVSADTLAEQTSQNANRFFGLSLGV